jgi:hypothetical protein
MEPTLSSYTPSWRDQLAQWMLGDGRPTAGQQAPNAQQGAPLL